MSLLNNFFSNFVLFFFALPLYDFHISIDKFCNLQSVIINVMCIRAYHHEYPYHHVYPGLWKFNNTLLEDENYKDLIEFYYPQILTKYPKL